MVEFSSNSFKKEFSAFEIMASNLLNYTQIHGHQEMALQISLAIEVTFDSLSLKLIFAIS